MAQQESRRAINPSMASNELSQGERAAQPIGTRMTQKSTSETKTG